MEPRLLQTKKSFLFLIVLGLSWIFSGHSDGQTGTCTVLQQPCNGDGILETVVTSGMTPPLTFQYYDHYNTVHYVSGLTDTYVGEAIPYVYIHDEFQHYLFLNTGMTPPFQTDYPVTTPAICPNPGTVSVTVNSGTLPDYVEWYDGTSPFPGNYIGTGNPMSLPGGYYTARIFYNGCSAYMDSAAWIQSISPITFDVSTTPANCTNGTASIVNLTGGSSPYSILWWNGATSYSVGGLSQGSYSVTVTDNIGCSTQRSFWIPQSVQIPVNMVVTQQPTCLEHDGKVMAFGSGGMNPYSYLWEDGQTTQEAVNLPGGYVGVLVTDANGCFGNGYSWLNSSTPIDVTFSATPSSCTSPTGTATVVITGGAPPYTVSWNTYPPQTGVTASGLAPGTYWFTVTDADGCIRTGSVPVPPQSVINASIWATNALCPLNTGSAGVSVAGISPFSFNWNTGATTQIIDNLPPGYYSCTITDGNSCTLVKTTHVQSVSPVSVGIMSNPASCMYAHDGSLYAVPTGGTPPYTYYWTNGSTTNTASNLLPGNYWVTVTDASGCSTTKFCVVTNSATSDACYCRIEGHVWYDPAESCSYTAGMTGIDHIRIHLEPFGYTWTDASGYFSFLVPSGTYTLSEVVQSTYPLTPGCPANDPVEFTVSASSGCTWSHDFFNVLNPLNDVHLTAVNWTMPVPGYTFTQKLFISNDGTVPLPDALLNFTPEPTLGPLVSAPPMTSAGTFYYNSDPIALVPGQQAQYFITYSDPVPVNMPLGTQLDFSGTVAYEPPISNWLDDYTPWNNWKNWTATVVGSFDPNTKEVWPAGEGTGGIISVNDSVLDYTIHFQNTGTWYAENVVITDTLDPDLDWTTVQPGASSHSYTAELSEDGVLKFTFSNIHLVWEAQNPINSNGMVAYSVKQRPGLDIGTEITNAAAIFFDFNPPVITGTTLNTIGIPEGIPGKKRQTGVRVYPDPAGSELFVDATGTGTVSSLAVYTITGSCIIQENAAPGAVQKLDVSRLSPGMYFLGIRNSRGETVTVKFIKR